MSENIEFHNSKNNEMKQNTIAPMSVTIKDNQINELNEHQKGLNKNNSQIDPNDILIISSPNTNEKSQAAQNKSSIKNRCEICKTKLSLAAQFTCRCDRNFCSKHRYAEDHSCTFDYKTHGKELLEKANNKVIGDKINKI